jgi:hypothetical protein
LNVRGKTDVASRPAKTNWQERRGYNPRLSYIALRRMPERQVPDDQQRERIDAQPRHRRLHEIREHEDEQRTQQFAEVGASDHDLRPSRVAQISSRDDGCDGVFKIAMRVQRNRVAREQPHEFPVRENDLAARPDGFEEEVEATRDGLDICWPALQKQAVL